MLPSAVCGHRPPDRLSALAACRSVPRRPRLPPPRNSSWQPVSSRGRGPRRGLLLDSCIVDLHGTAWHCCCPPLLQYYFETLFPRIPKTVSDDVRGALREWGLPTEARGNAGQGGSDRRGVDDGRARPASVKASLSVAFGQRAPNRPGGREVGRGMGADQQLERRGGGGGDRGDKGGDRRAPRRSASPVQRPPPRREDDRRHERDGGRPRSRSRSRDWRRGGGDRDRGWERRHERERSGERPPQGLRCDDYGGSRDGGRGRREYGDDGRGWGGHERRGREDERRDGGRAQHHGRSRSRSPSPSRGRDARDVFRDRPAAPAQADRVRSTYL
jgi:pre-mRNA-splicing factor 38B